MLSKMINALMNVYGYSKEDIITMTTREIISLYHKEVELAKRGVKVVQLTRYGRIYIGEKYTKVA